MTKPPQWRDPESDMVVKTTRITIETESLLVVHRGKTVVTGVLFAAPKRK